MLGIHQEFEDFGDPNAAPLRQEHGRGRFRSLPFVAVEISANPSVRAEDFKSDDAKTDERTGRLCKS